MVSRYKADGLCPSTLDTVPKPTGTIAHLFIQSFNPVPRSSDQHWGPQEGVGGEPGEEKGRDDFDLDLNSDLERSFP